MGQSLPRKLTVTEDWWRGRTLVSSGIATGDLPILGGDNATSQPMRVALVKLSDSQNKNKKSSWGRGGVLVGRRWGLVTVRPKVYL